LTFIFYDILFEVAKNIFKKKINEYRKKIQNLSKRREIYIVLIVVIFSAILYLIKGFIIAAVINGQPISRLSVVRDLEKRGGAQSLDTLISQALILQEAKKQNVVVTDEEINRNIAEIETNLEGQGGLDQILISEGMTRNDLIKQIRLQKLAEKMVSGQISVSDDEVNQYIEANKEYLPKDQSSEEINNTVRKQLEQQKLSEAIQTWLTDLRNKANIKYFVKY